VEAYNPDTGSWLTYPDIGHERVGASAAAFDGSIYVFGGADASSLLSSVEVFTPD
jgi:N-acetylneuraminic acid mutarotase